MRCDGIQWQHRSVGIALVLTVKLPSELPDGAHQSTLGYTINPVPVKSLLFCGHYLFGSEPSSGLHPPDALCVDVFTMLCDVTINDTHVEAITDLVWSMCNVTDAHYVRF